MKSPACSRRRSASSTSSRRIPRHHDDGRQQRRQDHLHRQDLQVPEPARQERPARRRHSSEPPPAEQLAVWGDRNKVEVIAQQGGDPAAVVFDAVSAGKARGTDVVIADTAGRLPTQINLMEELRRIRRAQDKAMTGAPHEAILVVDGTNGQNALTQVKAFDAAVGLTGLIVTKLDGTAKGRRARRHYTNASRKSPADLLHRRGRNHRRPAALQCGAVRQCACRTRSQYSRYSPGIIN